MIPILIAVDGETIDDLPLHQICLSNSFVVVSPYRIRFLICHLVELLKAVHCIYESFVSHVKCGRDTLRRVDQPIFQNTAPLGLQILDHSRLVVVPGKACQEEEES